MLAEPNWNKGFFYICATVVEADSRIDPPANIVEENVNSDSEARPRGVFFWTIQSLPMVEERERERENREFGDRSALGSAAGTGLVSFDFRLFSPSWRNTSRRKDRKLASRAYSFLFASSFFFFYSLQRVRTDREPISHYNGCSQDGSKVKLTCPTLSGSKNRVHTRKDGEIEWKEREEWKREKEGGKFALCASHTAKKINDLSVSDAISEIANKTDATSAYRVEVSLRTRARICVYATCT